MSLKVKSLEVKSVSHLIYFIGMFVLNNYLLKLNKKIYGFPCLLIASLCLWYLSPLLKVHDKWFLISLLLTFILIIDVHLIALKNLEYPLTKLDFACDAPQPIDELFMTFIDSIAQWLDDFLIPSILLDHLAQPKQTTNPTLNN